MSTGLAATSGPTPATGEASALVAAFRGHPHPDDGPWRLDRNAVAERLDQLIADPDRVRQGRFNLCGPATLCQVWLTRDPVAAVSYAISLFETGRGDLGARPVVASRGLMTQPYGQTERARSCPPADWLMMASLRDSTNRVLPYARPGGLGEPPAGITAPGALRTWLAATGCYSSIVDETRTLWPRGIAHAAALQPSAEGDVVLLVAQEMFRQPDAWRRRLRNRVVSRLPNHWVVLRSPVQVDRDTVRLRFWSWGETHTAALDRATFGRCYYGAIKTLAAPHSPA